MTGPYGVEGFLAQSWKRANNGSVTVTLRRGVRSFYGNTLTCNDVKWSFERNVAINGTARFLMSVGSIDQKNPITVISPRVCRVNTTAFSPVIYAALQHYFLAILDSTEARKHATSDDPWAKSWLATHTAGFGAYQVSSFIPSQRVEFVQNPGSFVKPKFTRLRVTQVTDPSTRLQLMLSGQADYASGFDWNQLRSASASKRLHVWKGVGPPVDAILPNFAVKEFQDVRVRQAISLGLDRAAIIRSAYSGFGKPGYRQITSAIPTPAGYKSPTISYNVNRARQLLAQAGLENGFSFRLALSPGRPGAYIQGVGELIQAQLARIGIRVELVVVPTAAQFQADRVAKKHDAVLVDVASAVADAPFTASLYYTSTGAQSQQNYSNQKVDQFARLALTTPPGKRRDRYTVSMLKALDANPPVIPVVEPTNTRVWAARISGQLSGSMVRGTGFVADQLAPR
jgi:peptide/nickel transport system substrate-binding protein